MIILDLETLKQYKPTIPFRVIEKDLYLDPVLRNKTYFTDKEATVNHRKELIQKGEIIIPIFRDKTIRPLGFQGKLLDYQIENKGAGFYVITQKIGKLYPKTNDHQHPHEKIDKKNTFYITYDRVKQQYGYVDSKKQFLKQYHEIENLKNSKDVQILINEFSDWIQTFWSTDYKDKHNFGISTSEQTYQNYLDVIEDIEKNIPMLRKYHLLLNIFGDITNKTYAYVERTINTLTERTAAAKAHINNAYPNPHILVDHSNDPKYAILIDDFYLYYEGRILTRGYRVDHDKKEALPNIAEIFFRNQFSSKFENDESKKQAIKDLIRSATTGIKFHRYEPRVSK
jgi:hypothetical protein